jgi:hypothetical protein
MKFSAWAVELAMQIHIHQFFKNAKNNSVKLNKILQMINLGYKNTYILYVVTAVNTSNAKIRTVSGSARGKT